MMTGDRVPDRRSDIRLDRSLQITLPGHKGETVNISATGVYFEVIANDTEAFSPGITIPIQINASSITPGFRTREINLNGSGSVVRYDIKGTTNHGHRLGVAMRFDDKLDLQTGLSQRSL
jgi:hypothetical protein